MRHLRLEVIEEDVVDLLNEPCSHLFAGATYRDVLRLKETLGKVNALMKHRAHENIGLGANGYDNPKLVCRCVEEAANRSFRGAYTSLKPCR